MNREKNNLARNIVILTFTIAIVIGVIIVFVLMDGSSNSLKTSDYNIFNKTEEIDNFIYNNDFEILNCEEDKYIGNLQYFEKASYKLIDEGKTYQIYAYAFVDNNDADKYYKNVTSNNRQKDEGFWTFGNYFFKTTGIYYKANKIYIIYGQDQESFMTFFIKLNTSLSEKIFTEK